MRNLESGTNDAAARLKMITPTAAGGVQARFLVGSEHQRVVLDE